MTPPRAGATRLGERPCHKEFSSPAPPAELGRAVVTTLHEAGFNVVAADQTYNRDLPVRTHVVDLRNALSLYPIIEGCRPSPTWPTTPTPTPARRPSSSMPTMSPWT